MKLYSELLTDKTALISYSHLKILKMIKMKTVVHKKKSELKKAEKLLK